jgi:cell division protein FtsB
MPRRVTRHQLKDYFLAGLLAFLVVWLCWLLFGIVRKEEIARHAVRDTNAELDTLQARKEVLEGNIAELNTSRGEEATYRETYGVAKPGEGVIIVVPAKKATSTPEISKWQKVLNWLHFW